MTCTKIEEGVSRSCQQVERAMQSLMYAEQQTESSECLYLLIIEGVPKEIDVIVIVRQRDGIVRRNSAIIWQVYITRLECLQWACTEAFTFRHRCKECATVAKQTLSLDVSCGLTSLILTSASLQSWKR